MYGVYSRNKLYIGTRNRCMYFMPNADKHLRLRHGGLYSDDAHSDHVASDFPMYNRVPFRIHPRKFITGWKRWNVYGVYTMHGCRYQRDAYTERVFRHNWTRNVFVFV